MLRPGLAKMWAILSSMATGRRLAAHMQSDQGVQVRCSSLASHPAPREPQNILLFSEQLKNEVHDCLNNLKRSSCKAYALACAALCCPEAALRDLCARTPASPSQSGVQSAPGLR